MIRGGIALLDKFDNFRSSEIRFVNFYTRKQLLLSARLSHCNSVCLSVHHTGGSVKNGAS